MMTIDTIRLNDYSDWIPAESGDPSAPTLVFIHGWLLSRHYWEPLINTLKADFSCLSYDLRGFGTARELMCQWPEDPARYTLEAYAKDLQTLLDDRGIRRAWLVGHSLGGSIALCSADLMGDRISGVTCVNAGGGIYLKEEFEKFRNAGQEMLKFRPNWIPNVPFLDRIFGQVAVGKPLGRDWGRQRLIDFVSADFAAATGSLLESTTEAEVHHLAHIVSVLKQPVHFITGDKDRIMEPRYVRHLASFHSHFQHSDESVLELPNCGHFAMVEYPDRVADSIRNAIVQAQIKTS
jgi:2-succinyl-6-hydroxy-2,4-cyclohexadiene-1-carboxylate synthase